MMTFGLSGDLQALVVWYALAAGLSALLVPLCRMAAIRYGYVARPREDRWHRKPTALLGGIAIAATALGLGFIAPGAGDLLLLLACSALMFAVGLTDDIVSLKPATKLIAEIAIAALFVLHGDRLHWTSSLTLDTLLTFVWLVGVTNAFNLLDNMDGLSAGITLIAGATLFIALFARVGNEPETRYLAVLLGATSGFLVYNIYPASIFMGDGGSLFLGLTLAALTLSQGGPAHDRSNVLSVVGVPMLVVLIPIFDTSLVTISRILSGRRVSQGGRDHSSHRLVAIGLSERAAVGVLWTLAAAAGGLSVVVRRYSADGGLLGGLFVLAMIIFAVYLAQVRVYDDAPDALPPGVTPLIGNFMYKRRLAEALLDVCLVTFAYYAAWRLRFEGPEWAGYSQHFLESLPIALAVQMVTLFVVGAYRGAWRHFGLMDGVTLAKGVIVGTLTIVAAALYEYRFENYSRGVFVIYAALLLLLLCGSRASFRLIGEFARRRQSGTRLVIYGAGEAGSLVVRELLGDANERYKMLGFIDDDPSKDRLRLQGYSVLGGHRTLLALIEQQSVDVVVISSRRFDDARLHAVEQACRQNQIRLLRFHFRLEPLVSLA